MLARLGRVLGLCNDAVYGGSKRPWAGAAWHAVDALASRLVMTERASVRFVETVIVPDTAAFDAAINQAFDQLARTLSYGRAARRV